MSRVFSKRAKEVNAKLVILNSSDLDAVDFDAFWNPDLPAYQKENFLCAYMLLNEIGYRFDPKQLKQAVHDFFWPARFQVLRQDPYLVLDGAHNPDGIEALVSSLLESKTKIDQIYFSVLADKQAHIMIRRLQDLCSDLHLVSFESDRLADLEKLSQEYNYPIVDLDTLFQELACTNKSTLVCG
ncbi:folylpolyglutamate synthase/dihydrofolate synthase, partial [gut metagenome]